MMAVFHHAGEAAMMKILTLARRSGLRLALGFGIFRQLDVHAQVAIDLPGWKLQTWFVHK